jgi:hypothetical protein
MLRQTAKSHQDYKGIFSDRSTGVFNGKIFLESSKQMLFKKTIFY